jgi:O-antigen ligase
MLLLTMAVALLPAGLALALVAGREPEARVLPAYAAVAPFGSGVAIPLGLPPEYTSLSSLLLLLLIGSLGLHVLARGSVARHQPPPVAVWLLLLGLMIATALWSVAPKTTLRALPVVASLVLLFTLLTQRRISGLIVRRVENGALVGGFAASLYGLYGAATGTLQTEDTTSPRFGSDLLGANHTAAALLLPYVITLWRLIDARTLRARIGYGALLGLLVVTIALTGSRGGALALVAGFVVVAAHARRPRAVLLGGALLAVVLGLAATYASAGLGARDNDSSSGRLDIWRIGWAACEDHCLTGSGWATFPTVYASYAPSVESAKVLRRGVNFESHNVVLQVVVETGIGGLLLLLLGVALTLRMAMTIPRAQRAPPLGGLVALLATSVFLSNFEFKYFWLTLSYVALCSLAASSGHEVAPGRRTREGAIG